MQCIMLMTLLMGVRVTAFSLYAAHRFRQVGVRLGDAISWTLFGEAFMGAVTTAFAIMEYTGRLDDLPVEAATAMRLSMFSFALITTGLLVKRMNEEV